MPGVKNEQTTGYVPLISGRQDRNTIIADGGDFTWVLAAGGTLSWTDIISVFVAGLGKHTVAAGNIAGVNAGYGVFVTVSRDVVGGLTVSTLDLTLVTTLANDDLILIGVRGEDNRFYFADGTTLDVGDTRALGTFGSSTIDRDKVLGDGVTTHFSTGFDYVMGSDQLLVLVGGIAVTRPGDYTEEDDNVDLKGDAVEFATAPGAAEVITFINLAGGQGPSGPAGGQTLQEAFDGGGDGAGSEIEVSATSGPVVLHDDDDSAARLLLQAGTLSDPDLFQLYSDGGIVTPRVTIPDGLGEFFTLEGVAGDLRIQHTGSSEALVVAKKGGLYFTAADARPAGADATGVLVATYLGTLPDEAVETVSTGITERILGVTLSIEDPDGDFWAQEMNLPSDTSMRLVVTYDWATGDVTVSGGTTKTEDPGVDFQLRDYTLLVFYRSAP